MPSTTTPPSSPPPTMNFLSDATNARNKLLDDIRIGATLKKSMTTEKSLVKSHGRVIDGPINNGAERISRSDSQSPEPKTNGNGNGLHFQEIKVVPVVPVYSNGNGNSNGNGYITPPAPPSTPAETSENFYTITVVPLKPQPIEITTTNAVKPQVVEITTTNAVKNSNFHALEKSALTREHQQQQHQPPLQVHKPLIRTTSSPAVSNARAQLSPFSPTKTTQFGFTLGRGAKGPPQPTGEKLMISHGKPNFVIQKRNPVTRLNGNTYGVKETMPKLKKTNNSVLLTEDEKNVQAAPAPTPVEVNFVQLDRQLRHQQMSQVEHKFNAVAISPSSSTTSSMSAASLDQPTTVASSNNHGPNFEQKTYVSFAKDLAVTPNKYPDMVKVTKFAETMLEQDNNPEQFQVDGYDLRLVKIDMEGGGLDEMKVVKRD